MNPLFSYFNYRDYLRDFLIEKKSLLRSYSLNSFARKLGVSSSYLSEVLKGKKNISFEMAHKIANKLGLSPKEEKFFVLLTQLENANGSDEKSEIVKKINKLLQSRKTLNLDLEMFSLFSIPEHIIALSLMDTSSPIKNAKVLSSRMKISLTDAESILERLIKLNLIEFKSGRYQKLATRMVAESHPPQISLQIFHQSMLQKSQDALRNQTNREKFWGTETLAFNPIDLPKVTQILDEACEQIIKLSEGQTFRDDVYHLGLHFFRLTEGRKINRDD